MKEIFSISSGVDVAKPIALLSKDAHSSDTSSSKDFLSIMFAQIEESLAIGESGKLDLKLEIPQEESTENIKIVSKDDSPKKSVDEHLLDDLLKVVSLLKTPEKQEVTFPSFSNKIEKIINNEVALKELKEVKNITDLLKLSKKYDLGLEKISVKKLDIESLQKEFPKLDKTFFETPKKSIQKADIPVETTKKEPDVKPTVLSLNNIEKPIKDTKKEPTLFEKIMSTPKQETQKEDIPKIVVKEDVKQTLKVVQEETPKVVVKEDVKQALKVVQEDAPKIIVKEDTKKTLKIVQEDAPKVVSKEKIDVKVDKQIEVPKHTRTTEVKVETDMPKKGIVEDILQTIKPEKNKAPSVAQTTTLTEEKSKNDGEIKEVKTEPIQHKTEIKPQIKTETTHSKPVVHTKETFNNFANEFKEKLENYKPPIMRVQMALTPKGLGDVDVTIVNRGQNLHVNITSNTTTMATFTQNQAEFKNSLVNMGFTNLEMNFSDQRERNQGQNKNNNSSNGEFNEEFLEEDTTSIELVVPQYV